MDGKHETGTILNVLLLEDSVRDFEIIREQLVDAGFDLNISRIEKEMEFVSSIRGNKYDIILVDYSLPGFDAFSALRLRNEICPDVPFLCVSGSIGEETVIELIKQGAVDYILKDRLAKLPSAIKRALNEAKEKEMRRLAEEALQRSEREKELVLNSTAELFVYYDLELNIQWANRAVSESVGQKIEDLIGRHCYEIWHGRDSACIGCPVLKARDTGQPHEMEIVSPDRRWWHVRGYPVFDQQGKVIALTEFTQDITERKLAEEALRESEEKFRRIFEDHAAVKLLIDPDSGEIIDANKAAAVYYGWTREELKRMNIEQINILTPEEVKKEMENARSQKRIQFEFRHRRKDGSIRDVEVFSSNIKIQGKDILHSIIHDIMERKLAEEEVKTYREQLEELVKERTNDLAKDRNLLRTLIDSLPDEIYAKDSDSRYIIANSHVLRLFDLPDIDDIIGKTDFEILPRKEAMKYYRTEHAVLLAKGQTINYEESFPDPDGNLRWYSITKVPLRDNKGNITGLVGINRDITYTKEYEKALKAAKEAAESANLAKSTFLSSMSHEIRTPLNAILGFSELMQADENLSKKHIEWLGTINRSGEHLLDLINDILEVSRIEAGRISLTQSTFNIHSMLSDIEEMFRVKTDKKNLSLILEYSDELPRYIVTDKAKLKQIIINLIGNAVKFTKKGGIAVRAHVKHENDKTRFVAEIEDTGPGIAEKDIDKLFRKFGQTEAGIREGGTGLGLAISRQYAKLMNGDIIVKSEVEKGACFTLTIDIESGKKSVKEENQKRRVIGLKPGQKRYRVLIADDREDNRELLKIMLTSVGFEVEEVRNGKEVIEKFKAQPPDLILLDIRMPVMDGYETVHRIKNMRNGKIPIIAVTASAFQEDRGKALEAGVDAYLRKPFKESELFECIGSCLGIEYVYK